jgi:hypothetical protein
MNILIVFPIIVTRHILTLSMWALSAEFEIIYYISSSAYVSFSLAFWASPVTSVPKLSEIGENT